MLAILAFACAVASAVLIVAGDPLWAWALAMGAWLVSFIEAKHVR